MLRNLRLACVVGLGATLGCSPPPQKANQAAGAVDAPAPPEHGKQISFGPFNVAAGGEVQVCRTFKLGNANEMAVNRINVVMNQGSHHFIIFRAKRDMGADQTFACWGTVNFDDWEFVLDVNKTGGEDWQLHDGQGFIFEPNQQMMVQSHFVNATTVQSPAGGMVYANLYEIDRAKVQHELYGKFTVNTNLALPPMSNFESYRDCTFNRGVRVVAMTGHFHARGTMFRVREVTDPQTGQFPPEMILRDQIYCSGPDCECPGGAADCPERHSGWDSPLFKTFDPPLFIDAIEGVRFTCDFYNYTTNMIGFGGHADVQEHCNLFFQYYYDLPADQTPLDCAQGTGGW
jgi:hypothetical protein